MIWRHLLRPLTPLYAAAVTLRAAAYRRGLLGSRRLPIPVVSIGNLTFGGTGKTPTTISLVRDLARRGKRPGVLTRGYGRQGSDPLVVVGPEHQFDAAMVGDEALEMASRLPGVPIVVDADRVRGGRTAMTMHADIVILDDGFQHLRIARDLDLVLIDAGDPWGGGHLPPLGRLREPVNALARASAVLVTKLPARYEPVLSAIEHRVRDIRPDLPILASRLEPQRLLIDGNWDDPSRLAGQRVLAFAGLGRPEGFATLLEEAGARIVGRRWFPDHHSYSTEDERHLASTAAELDCVPVTTAKDAVKLTADFQPWVVEAGIVPIEGTWDRLWRLLPGGTV